MLRYLTAINTLVFCRLGKTESYERLCENPSVVESVLAEIRSSGLSSGLQKFELPTALTLSPLQWTPESGHVTAAFKLKRKVVQHWYRDSIERMYKRSEGRGRSGDC